MPQRVGNLVFQPVLTSGVSTRLLTISSRISSNDSATVSVSLAERSLLSSARATRKSRSSAARFASRACALLGSFLHVAQLLVAAGRLVARFVSRLAGFIVGAGFGIGRIEIDPRQSVAGVEHFLIDHFERRRNISSRPSSIESNCSGGTKSS